VTNYITEPTNITSVHWGPHEGPHADVFTGVGGYEYDGVDYGQSAHQGLSNGCVDCHMAVVEDNQDVGDHSFYPQLSTCLECHNNATSFDVAGGRSAMLGGIQELRAALNDISALTQSPSSPYEPLTDELDDVEGIVDDHANPDAGSLTQDEAGALYNYLILARGAAGGIHNPLYTRQLIYDSVVALTGNPPATLPTRPE
jgi:hypothetical protein